MYFKTISIQLLSILSLVLSVSSQADVSVPKLVSDGLVLQSSTEVPLWGWAAPDEIVTIKLDGQLVSKTPARDGKWKVQLKPQPAGGPHTLSFEGKNLIEVNDVYFGDVWIASGQSNMQTPMGRLVDKFPEEFLEPDYPLIRVFTVPGAYDFNKAREDTNGGTWKKVGATTIDSISGVAYFFAKDLFQKYKVPIGIINSSFGGSPAQAWMSEKALKKFPHHLESIEPYKDASKLKQLMDMDKAASTQWQGQLDKTDKGLSNEGNEWFSPKLDDSKWQTLEVPGFWEEQNLDIQRGVVWYRTSIDLPPHLANKPAILRLGTIVDADTAYINGIRIGGTSYLYPPRRYSVAPNILKAGENNITVRVISNSNPGGFVVEKPYYLEIDGFRTEISGTWHYRVGAEMPEMKEQQFNQYSQALGRYNAMLAPLLNTQIKGVIWYQGESNTERDLSEEYSELFPAMIRDWRESFNQGNFPFLYVQLANFLKAEDEPSESHWAEVRQGQLEALKEPNTAMVTAIDVGEWNDIHPLDKKTVGERLALAAQALAYNEDDVNYSGPLVDSVTRKGDSLVISFKHVGKGLTYRGSRLDGFAIKGKFGKYTWADAKLEGDKVVVSKKGVIDPSHVRYGWADNPVRANLYNREGLPAPPFEAQVKTEP